MSERGLTASKQEIAEITCGRVVDGRASLLIEGVENDSRLVRPGSLFVALKGELEHGHAYLSQALELGASLMLVEDPSLLDTFPAPERLVVVDDTLRAFSALASWWRRKTAVPLIAVTGSLGKTTVKEFLGAVLSGVGAGTLSQRSYNNHVGVPYTLCRIRSSDSWAVIEMGMNHRGEIDSLSRIASPDVAVITGIAPVHIGLLGSLEEIAGAKLEILSGLKEGGVLVIPAGVELLERHLSARNSSYSVARFGGADEPNCQCTISGVRLHGLQGVCFNLELCNQIAAITLGSLGLHSAKNAACAALAAHCLLPALPVASIASGLERSSAAAMRLEVSELANGCSLVDDSYNSSPEAVKAALEIMSDLQGSGKRIGLVLGDMLELGDMSGRYHQDIGESVGRLGPAFIAAVGEYAEDLLRPSERLGIAVFRQRVLEEAALAVFLDSHDCDVLLVKGSRGVKLDRLVTLLKAQHQLIPMQ